MANNEFQGSLNVRFIYTTFKVLKFDFKDRTLVAAKQLLNSFLFEMGKSKRCVLVILSTFRALVCLNQEITWIVGTNGELTNNITLFLFNN